MGNSGIYRLRAARWQEVNSGIPPGLWVSVLCYWGNEGKKKKKKKKRQHLHACWANGFHAGGVALSGGLQGRSLCAVLGAKESTFKSFLRIYKKDGGCFPPLGYCLMAGFYLVTGINSSLSCIPMPSARRRRVRREGLALPFSSLLMSAWAMPVFSASCCWVMPLAFRASIMA